MERRKVKWLMGLLLLALVLASLSLGTMAAHGKQVAYINIKTGEKSAEGPVEIVDTDGLHWLLALHASSCFEIVLETSGVSGYWADLGNSDTNNGDGGDAATFRYDSEVTLYNSRLSISGNDEVYARCPHFSHPYVNINNFAAPSGEVRIQVGDGFVRVESGGNFVTLPSCTTCDIPCVFASGHGRYDSEHHGPNDNIYWLAINGVITGDPSRPGSGVGEVTIFLYPGGGSCCGCGS